MSPFGAARMKFPFPRTLLTVFSDLQLLRLIHIGCTIVTRTGLSRGSHVTHDRGQERKQAPAKRHAEKGDGGSIRPEQRATDETADQSRKRVDNHHVAHT